MNLAIVSSLQDLRLPVATAQRPPGQSEQPGTKPQRITYLHGIALKERGVILHGLEALARRCGVPETTREGLNSSRLEKLLGLIQLILRTEERGQVLKSSYGTIAAKLHTSESTVKDLITKVNCMGLFTKQFQGGDQMYEIQSGPALHPDAWAQLLVDGQRALRNQIIRNTKENVVGVGSRSWTEPRRYPRRRQYAKTTPVVHPHHPGEVHLGGPQQQEPQGQRFPSPHPQAVQTNHPGEVHLGIEELPSETPKSLSTDLRSRSYSGVTPELLHPLGPDGPNGQQPEQQAPAGQELTTPTQEEGSLAPGLRPAARAAASETAIRCARLPQAQPIPFIPAVDTALPVVTHSSFPPGSSVLVESPGSSIRMQRTVASVDASHTYLASHSLPPDHVLVWNGWSVSPVHQDHLTPVK